MRATLLKGGVVGRVPPLHVGGAWLMLVGLALGWFPHNVAGGWVGVGVPELVCAHPWDWEFPVIVYKNQSLTRDK